MKVWIVLTSFEREELDDLRGAFEGAYASSEAAQKALSCFQGDAVLVSESIDEGGAYEALYEVNLGYAKIFTDEVGS